MQHQHLVVIGFDEIVADKYARTIKQAIADGHLDSYSVIDLSSRRAEVEKRLRHVDPQPEEVVLLPDEGRGDRAQAEASAALTRHLRRCRSVKAYIATEVQAHETYLRLSNSLGLPALVEKPVLAPVVGGRFEPALISTTLADIAETANSRALIHSVMTLSRYHRIYNGCLIDGLRRRMASFGAPLTSLHLRASGGVWNLRQEYEHREDHPYRYGYGMLMHGAYHYVDLAVQLLELNKELRPDARLRLDLSSFGAFPCDQGQRIPERATRSIDDSRVSPSAEPEEGVFGETDITTAFRLVDSDTGRTVTVGTLAFEQTTPSIRAWGAFPTGVYNKNGRTSSVDIEAQLSTLYSTHVHCYDVPRCADPDRVDAYARVTSRANATLLEEEEYVSVQEFHGLFHSDSNRALMHNWLRGEETKSTLPSHLLPMKVTEALATSLVDPGHAVSIDF